MLEEVTQGVESIIRALTPDSEADRRLALALHRCLSELHETAARSARDDRHPQAHASLRLV